MDGWVCPFVTRKDLPKEISNLKMRRIFIEQMGQSPILTVWTVTDRFHYQFSEQHILNTYFVGTFHISEQQLTKWMGEFCQFDTQSLSVCQRKYQI